MDDIEDDVPRHFERWAGKLLEEADKVAKAAEAEDDPAAKEVLLDTEAQMRALARREKERAAIADDPQALQRWVEGLSPEQREQHRQRIERLRQEGEG